MTPDCAKGDGGGLLARPAVARRDYRSPKRSREVIDDIFLDAFVDLYRFGLSARQVAVVFGVKSWAVQNLLKRHDVAMRPHGKLDDVQAERLRALRREGATFKQLGVLFGVTGPCAFKICHRQSHNKRGRDEKVVA